MATKRGVGTIITEELGRYGITSGAGCDCAALSAELDEVGPEVIEEKFDYYVDRFRQSIKKWRGSGGLRILLPPPPKFVIIDLLRWGIEEYRLECALQDQTHL